MLAASDSWRVTFRGSGGHGGLNVDRTTDPSIPLGQFILGLQTIISRKVPANESAVVSIGHISGGEAKSPNIIPATYFVTGTARSYSPTVQDTIEATLRQLADGLARSHGCDSTFEYDRRYPPVINASVQTRIAVSAARAVVGPDHVEADIAPSMGAEDFSFMLNARPGAFIWIGNGRAPGGGSHGIHTPQYDFNDDILPIGSAYWVSLVAQELGPATS
jgi:hippurate hydrolase